MLPPQPRPTQRIHSRVFVTPLGQANSSWYAVNKSSDMTQIWFNLTDQLEHAVSPPGGLLVWPPAKFRCPDMDRCVMCVPLSSAPPTPRQRNTHSQHHSKVKPNEAFIIQILTVIPFQFRYTSENDNTVVKYLGFPEINADSDYCLKVRNQSISSSHISL